MENNSKKLLKKSECLKWRSFVTVIHSPQCIEVCIDGFHMDEYKLKVPEVMHNEVRKKEKIKLIK